MVHVINHAHTVADEFAQRFLEPFAAIVTDAAAGDVFYVLVPLVLQLLVTDHDPSTLSLYDRGRPVVGWPSSVKGLPVPVREPARGLGLLRHDLLRGAAPGPGLEDVAELAPCRQDTPLRLYRRGMPLGQPPHRSESLPPPATARRPCLAGTRTRRSINAACPAKRGHFSGSGGRHRTGSQGGEVTPTRDDAPGFSSYRALVLTFRKKEALLASWTRRPLKTRGAFYG